MCTPDQMTMKGPPAHSHRTLGLALLLVSLTALLLTGCATTISQTVAEPAGSVDEAAIAADIDIILPPLTQPSIAGPATSWQPWRINPTKRLSRYEVVRYQNPSRQSGIGQTVMRATADRSASGLMTPVSLQVAPGDMLSWQWRILRYPRGQNIAERSLEDSPARVILAFDGPVDTLPLKDQVMMEKARLIAGRPLPYATLMYVWDKQAPTETLVQNAWTGRIRSLVVATGVEAVGTWQRFERDVVRDFEAAYGEKPGRLIGVGIMTDADNTGDRAEALYADLQWLVHAPAATLRSPDAPTQ